MILITGGTGFVGRVLIRQLREHGHAARLLLRPSARTPNLPRNQTLEVMISRLDDERGLQAALSGVKTVYHLVGAERQGAQANLLETDIRGTQILVQAARTAGVERIFALSHLGADRASAYPLLKTKAIVEEHLRSSKVDFTILRTALLFGPGDRFTTAVAQIGSILPFFLIPGSGDSLIQPLWVEDLVTCLVWALDREDTHNQTYELGGPEVFPFRHVVQMILEAVGRERLLINMRPPYLRGLTMFLASIFPALPVSTFWLDYLATSRTTFLETIPREFGLLPSRFGSRLDYLRNVNWRAQMVRSLFRRERSNGRG